MLKLAKSERYLLTAVLALLAAAIFSPYVAQSARYHDFADGRVWGSVPFAMDVLSNLPFALWGAIGLAGVVALSRQSKPLAGQLALAALFFAGLPLTATASAWYHWLPNDSGLALDRLGMTVAFAGLLGLAAAGRISLRAGWSLAGSVLVLGPLSIWVWAATANVLPWALLQFGGMAMVVWFAFTKALPGALPVRWGMVIAIYALAKLLEVADHQIYDLTSHLVSGHSLKHVVASLAAWPVLVALQVCMSGGKTHGLASQKLGAESPALFQYGQRRPGSAKL